MIREMRRESSGKPAGESLHEEKAVGKFRLEAPLR